MLDPSMLDPNVFAAAKKAGLDHVDDMNHNGKLDVQDVALMTVSMPVPASTIAPATEPVIA